jgi:hypothetical protein
VLKHLHETFAELVTKQTFVVSFECEKMFMNDEIQRSFTTRRIGKSHLYVRRLGHLAPMLGDNWRDAAWPRAAWRILFTHPSRQETVASAEALYAAMDRLRMLTPYEQKLPQTDDDMARIEKLRRGNMLVDLIGPAVEKVIEIGHRVSADAEATLAVSGLLRYEQRHGRYPDSLKAAAEAGYLAATPMDPYTNEPLIYRRVEGGFTLYSTGRNGADNGGKVEFNDSGSLRFWAERDGDTVFWPVYQPPPNLLPLQPVGVIQLP